MNSLDRVTEAARAITNLGLPDNCVYSKLTPFEQSVVNEFFQVCFAHRRELQDDIGYTISELEGAAIEAYERGHAIGWDEGREVGFEEAKEKLFDD